jgi:hypothetical protein
MQAITDLLLTYDNPFSAARPLHEAPVGYQQRNFNGNPQAADAVKLNYSRIDYNLNLGAGGADISLWLRRLGQSATQLTASASSYSLIEP